MTRVDLSLAAYFVLACILPLQSTVIVTFSMLLLASLFVHGMRGTEFQRRAMAWLEAPVVSKKH